MATNIAIAAVGVFLLGAVAGVILIVTIGIRREERHFQEWRRYRQLQGTWWGPSGPQHFMPEVPPDRVTHGARALTRLFVRREPIPDPEVVPSREAWPWRNASR